MADLTPEQRRIEEDLGLARTVGRLSGEITDAQLHQFRYWPLLAVPGGRSSNTRIDQKKHLVHVEVEADAGTPRQVEFLEGFGRSVRWLLGDDWRACVHAAGWSWPDDPPCQRKSKSKKSAPTQG